LPLLFSGENLEPLPATPAMASASDFEERLIQLCYKINDACRTNQQPEMKVVSWQTTAVHFGLLPVAASSRRADN